MSNLGEMYWQTSDSSVIAGFYSSARTWLGYSNDTCRYPVISGTGMLKETGGFFKMFGYIFSHIGANATVALYRTMTVEQMVFLGVFVLLSYPLYLGLKWVNSKFMKRVFMIFKFKDEQ